MKVQVLASIMNEPKNRIKQVIERMHITSDAIIINQCERNDVEEYTLNDTYKIKMLSFQEKGVGLSRNNALMRSDADIVIFADNDVVYVDDYVSMVQEEFEKQKDADMIVFRVPKIEEKAKETTEKNKRVRLYNCLKYGAVRFAVKRESINKKNIYFSLLFGGGTTYGSGEDSIFITECIRKGLKVYHSNKILGYLMPNESTWFKGYNEKFFIDKGALFQCLFPRFSTLMSLQFIMRHKNFTADGINALYALKLMNKGKKIWKGKMKYD